MTSSQPNISWTPGDLAVIATGEFAGMDVRVDTVNSVEGKAVVRLRVFGKAPFEIELSDLQKSRSFGWQVLKAPAVFFSGPILVFATSAICGLLSESPLEGDSWDKVWPAMFLSAMISGTIAVGSFWIRPNS